MRKSSTSDANQVYFSAATLAAHFNFRGEGFRQKDVRFLIELFSNWMEAALGESALPLHNTQLARYLDELARDGIAKRLRDRRAPRYELTRAGLVKLLTALFGKPRFVPLDHLFFIHYFLKSYGKLFDDLLQAEGAHFSPSLRAELVALRSPQVLVQNQLRFLDKEIAKIDGRIQEARDAAALAEGTLARGGSLEEAVAQIQKKYPYELNTRKPLRELIGEVPEGFRAWEMTDGLRNRAEFLWVPLKAYFERTREILAKLAQS